MEEPVALNVEAGKENEQTLANFSPAEEATSKDEVEIEKKRIEKERMKLESSSKTPLLQPNSMKQTMHHNEIYLVCFNSNASTPQLTFRSWYIAWKKITL